MGLDLHLVRILSSVSPELFSSHSRTLSTAASPKMKVSSYTDTHEINNKEANNCKTLISSFLLANK